MRFTRLLILLLVLMLPCIALADTTITITFTGDVTLGGEDDLQTEPYSFTALYDKHGPEYFLANFADPGNGGVNVLHHYAVSRLKLVVTAVEIVAEKG